MIAMICSTKGPPSLAMAAVSGILIHLPPWDSDGPVMIEVDLSNYDTSIF